MDALGLRNPPVGLLSVPGLVGESPATHIRLATDTSLSTPLACYIRDDG